MTSESSVAGHTPGPWMAAAKPSSVVGWPVVGRMEALISWLSSTTRVRSRCVKWEPSHD